MALQSALLVPAAQDGTRTTLAATTASSFITIGKRSLFAFNSDQDSTITFGLTSATAPSSTVGFQIFAGTTVTFDLGEFDGFRIYNLSSSTANFAYMQLSRF